jgi:hypothetical protein
VAVLLLALACSDAAADEDAEADPVDVPAHYYPH